MKGQSNSFLRLQGNGRRIMFQNRPAMRIVILHRAVGKHREAGPATAEGRPEEEGT